MTWDAENFFFFNVDSLELIGGIGRERCSHKFKIVFISHEMIRCVCIISPQL